MAHNITESKWTLLTRHLLLFCKNLELTELLVHLECNGILSKQQIHEIESAKTPFERNKELITRLQKRPEDNFPKFCRILAETGHKLLLQTIDPHNCSLQAISSSTYSSKSSEKEAVRKLATELQAIYRERLRLVNPFSLPFTFDIEKTWVALGLHIDNADDRNRPSVTRRRLFSRHTDDDMEVRRMEDHCQLIGNVFQSGPRLLLIEGRAACGKTCLMRRIAYDWANGKLTNYNLVILVEFRHLPESSYNTIADLVLSGIKSWAENDLEHCEELKKQITLRKAERSIRLLILLDGFDEAQSSNVCMEIKTYLESSSPMVSLPFDVIISSRPGSLTVQKNYRSRLNVADVLGFDEKKQRIAYISAHFSNAEEIADKSDRQTAVLKLLNKNRNLADLAKTPLFLTFICLVHEYIEEGTVFELYRCIIWWLIDRFQRDHPDLNVPLLFGFDDLSISSLKSVDNHATIQKCFLQFPLLQRTGQLSLEMYPTAVFKEDVVLKYEISKEIIQCGLLLFDENRKNLAIETSYFFPHRTIQEFLAGGLFYFWPGFDADRHCLAEYYSKIGNLEAELQEIDNFIFGSTSAEIISPLIIDYIKWRTSIKIDLSLIQRSPRFSKTLNWLLRRSVRVRSLTLQSNHRETIDVFEPFDISQMPDITKITIGTSEWDIKLRFDVDESNIGTNDRDIKFRFDVDESILTFGETHSKLQAIKLLGISFASSSIFCLTLKTLIERVNKNATLELENVVILLNETHGIGELKITFEQIRMAYYRQIPDYEPRYITELSKLFDYFAWVENLRITMTSGKLLEDKSKGEQTSFFPISKFVHLKEISLINFCFEAEKELRYFDFDDANATVEQISFVKCTFYNEDSLYMLLHSLSKAFQHETLSVIFILCTVLFKNEDGNEITAKFDNARSNLRACCEVISTRNNKENKLEEFKKHFEIRNVE